MTLPVLYTLNGAAVDMWTGYQADIARYLTSPWNSIWAQFVGEQVDSKYYWQPVAFDPTPVPMSGGIKQGTTEFVRLLTDVHPVGQFAICAYSEGSIIAANIWDMLNDPSSVIHHRLGDFLGAATFGCPRRMAGHTFPGGRPVLGQGIVTPNMGDPGLVPPPDTWWDFANDKHIPGSAGDDLYTTCCGETGDGLADIRAIWGFVYNVWDGFEPLTKAILKFFGLDFFKSAAGMISAIVVAVEFFGTEQLVPHTDYQFTMPKIGSNLTSWQLALSHLASLVGQELAP